MQVELVVPPNVTKSKVRGKSEGGHSKMFPVLVFLLVACYGIMTLVVVEQGNVIQSQRNLIAQLMQDSSQLSALQGQEQTRKQIEKKQKEALHKGKAGHEVGHGSGDGAANQAGPIAKGPASEPARKLLGHKSRIEKQPMQADDKVDRRRFPAQI